MRKLSIQHILPAGRIFVAAAVLLTPAAAQDRRIAIYDFESRAADASLRGRVPQASDDPAGELEHPI